MPAPADLPCVSLATIPPPSRTLALCSLPAKLTLPTRTLALCALRMCRTCDHTTPTAQTHALRMQSSQLRRTSEPNPPSDPQPSTIDMQQIGTMIKILRSQRLRRPTHAREGSASKLQHSDCGPPSARLWQEWASSAPTIAPPARCQHRLLRHPRFRRPGPERETKHMSKSVENYATKQKGEAAGTPTGVPPAQREPAAAPEASLFRWVQGSVSREPPQLS